MSHWGRNNKSFYKSRLTAYNKCAHAVSLKIGLAYTPRFSTTDHWIKESIKRIFSSGLFCAVGAVKREKKSQKWGIAPSIPVAVLD